MTRSTTTGVCLATVLFTGVLVGQTRSVGGGADVTSGTLRSVYADFGVRTIVNVAGSATRVGGAQMPPEVVQAMAAAALESVSMMELQAAASRRIAAATGAEAGFVTAGASAGLTLGTAAILAGFDLAKMERLPDTAGMKNEFIISREHRNGYDHAIRVAGAKLVDVGMNEQLAGAGVRRTEAWEYEAAITDMTAGIAYVITGNSQPPLEQVVAVARKHGLPVLVDAAGQLPSGLRRLIASGAALVSSSGGKGLKGPQSTGILCGRKDYIASVALQSLDMDEYFDIWDPPEDFIPKSRLPGLPRHGIGRGFKVGKEEVIGLLTALKLSEGDASEDAADAARRHLESIVRGLKGLPVEPRLNVPRERTAMPSLQLVLNRPVLGRSAFEIARELKHGDPGVFVNERLLEQETLVINPMHLDSARTDALTRRLRAVLSSGPK
jgi:seryl-tRNA(Sec) selenium transferase